MSDLLKSMEAAGKILDQYLYIDVAHILSLGECECSIDNSGSSEPCRAAGQRWFIEDWEPALEKVRGEAKGAK